ncbi:MAG: helix-turn-helix transcriptional regulator, partial [Proteobacteria bacterium]|nr:helix-turn-helix transcriptional regulator [Pseudomonadota bacterium]
MPKADTDWKTIKLPEIRALARPLFLRSQVLPARSTFPMHRHEWHQLVYAISGTLSVAVEDSWHVVTPDQAIWIPQRVMHTTATSTGAEFRSLYVASGRSPSMPRTSTVFDVTPLFKALILELASFGKRREDDVYVSQVERLTISQLRRLSPQDFSLPWPRSKSLHQICDALFASPGDKRDINHWAAEVGASVRSLERRFEDEVGLTFRT